MKTELLTQSEKMLQIKEHTDSIHIVCNDQSYVSIFANPCEKITEKAISVCLPFSETRLWIPKSLILLMDRNPNTRGGMSYEIVLPEWFLRQNNIKK
tara:strand:- start:3828 stop:4118 length:291 start_codon:yes stop_codon:yes gene_type:complete